jgi:signal transduction histidine kinase
LGLAISYQIITQHQGRIEVRSAPGQGAEFVITMPVKGPGRV